VLWRVKLFDESFEWAPIVGPHLLQSDQTFAPVALCDVRDLPRDELVKSAVWLSFRFFDRASSGVDVVDHPQFERFAQTKDQSSEALGPGQRSYPQPSSNASGTRPCRPPFCRCVADARELSDEAAANPQPRIPV
jgi:hypothetical protein